MAIRGNASTTMLQENSGSDWCRGCGRPTASCVCVSGTTQGETRGSGPANLEPPPGLSFSPVRGASSTGAGGWSLVPGTAEAPASLAPSGGSFNLFPQGAPSLGGPPRRTGGAIWATTFGTKLPISSHNLGTDVCGSLSLHNARIWSGTLGPHV